MPRQSLALPGNLFTSDGQLEMIEKLLIRQFHLALRDRQVSEDEAADLFRGIVNLAAMRAAALVSQPATNKGS